MDRLLYEHDHEGFRQVVASFVDRTVAARQDAWEHDRIVDRDTWLEAGRHGIIGLSVPIDYGGGGQMTDYRFRMVVNEEIARVGSASLNSSFGLHDDILVPYIANLGTEEQRRRWLPKMASGELIVAIAMTEPGAGSDLRGVRTTGRKVDGGWIVNGTKTFITSGYQADLVVTVVRTGQSNSSRDFSLLVIEADMAGFDRGRKLRKIGLHAQDTAELSFTDVFVPDENVLGSVGGGFGHLMTHLPLERLSIAAAALAAMRAAFEWTLTYVEGRKAFGQPIMDFQNTRFRLADMSAEIIATEALVDRAVMNWNAGTLTAVDAARVKLWASEAQGRVIDQCLQLHGGYGYMEEYPIARAYQDARIQRIYGGTSEIMREIIGRDLAGRR